MPPDHVIPLSKHVGLVLINLGNQRHLVENEGDEALLEAKGKVAFGVLTTSR